MYLPFNLSFIISTRPCYRLTGRWRQLAAVLNLTTVSFFFSNSRSLGTEMPSRYTPVRDSPSSTRETSTAWTWLPSRSRTKDTGPAWRRIEGGDRPARLASPWSVRIKRVKFDETLQRDISRNSAQWLNAFPCCRK